MLRFMHRASCVTALAALAALPLAACGGDDDEPTPSASTDEPAPSGDAIVIDALDSLSFDPDTATAAAGTIEFELVNDGSLPHTLVIEDHEDDLRLSVGDTDAGSIELEAGEYAYYCDVAGHRAGGMEGTLSVE